MFKKNIYNLTLQIIVLLTQILFLINNSFNILYVFFIILNIFYILFFDKIYLIISKYLAKTKLSFHITKYQIESLLFFSSMLIFVFFPIYIINFTTGTNSTYISLGFLHKSFLYKFYI